MADDQNSQTERSTQDRCSLESDDVLREKGGLNLPGESSSEAEVIATQPESHTNLGKYQPSSSKAQVQEPARKVDADAMPHILNVRHFQLFWQKRSRTLFDVDALLSFNRRQLTLSKTNLDSGILNEPISWLEARNWSHVARRLIRSRLNFQRFEVDRSFRMLRKLRESIHRRRAADRGPETHHNTVKPSAPSRSVLRSRPMERHSEWLIWRPDGFSTPDLSKGRPPESLRTPSSEYNFFL